MAGGETTSMFAGSPQPVEIHHRGIWYSGELIGWRHEGNGRVAARVRCVVDGLRHSTWKDLTDLRLPDPENPPRRERFPAVVRRTTPVVPDEDETRPHVLLAGARGRAAKPAHAVSPPVPTPGPRADQPRDDPQPASTAARRRSDEPHWRKAYLSIV